MCPCFPYCNLLLVEYPKLYTCRSKKDFASSSSCSSSSSSSSSSSQVVVVAGVVIVVVVYSSIATCVTIAGYDFYS